MKSYTDLEQSKKLAEILPLESADMCYIQDLLANGKYGEYKPYIGDLIPAYGQDKIRCWSLAALLNVLPLFSEIISMFELKGSVPLLRKTIEDYVLYYDGDYKMTEKKGKDIEVPFEIRTNNSVDACYEMILKLHELNLL